MMKPRIRVKAWRFPNEDHPPFYILFVRWRASRHNSIFN